MADLARVYPWLDDAAAPYDLPAPVLHSMHVALEEAVMNLVMHGLPPGGDDTIVVRLSTQPGTAVLVVEDAGEPFDSTSAPEKPQAKSLAEAEVGGLGMKLLRHYCKDISYARIDDVNRLTLRFSY